MPVLWIVLIVFAAAAIGYAVARNRALASAGGNARGLHSCRPIMAGTRC
jgi:phosphate transport system permease protein